MLLPTHRKTPVFRQAAFQQKADGHKLMFKILRVSGDYDYQQGSGL